MKKHNCEECKFRGKYDQNPNSLSGKLWRWHINFCPGWKAYMASLEDEKKNEVLKKYHLS
ncbi:hypothetical protein L3Q72_20830 [Vibrio sp. JC009]|uniref:hypothetical protein n=1 Tax=Vibrio sp. JC009 TaxID=2912314 RepID=UPI0023AFC790|nr:hypothetical protein [Vibrio sp. JC009]WED23683.1 hypothetical protein L3Q72_20830 [Vibrio sp. JC009]